ncbi:Zn-ribbon domain-containing OB-fold protein [Streptomyces sp. NPDC090106]|uniref:Zn-ribbon domain-containing OB-fold protein n=1 Tax=Streptomyces sp. NPDC090106 TaxID=3365946 RepID=UPI0037F933EC
MLSPVTDADGAPFWRYAAQGELRVQTCAGCETPRFPPRPCCPHCHSFESIWRRTSGLGRIWSYVVPHPPLLPDYAALTPYTVAVVELADAPHIRLVGNLVAAPGAPLDSLAPGRVRIGARVRFAYDEGSGLAQWVPERS